MPSLVFVCFGQGLVTLMTVYIFLLKGEYLGCIREPLSPKTTHGMKLLRYIFSLNNFLSCVISKDKTHFFPVNFFAGFPKVIRKLAWVRSRKGSGTF